MTGPPKPSNVNNVFDDDKEEQYMATNKSEKQPKKRKLRYNPYKDPNFDPNGAQYKNNEFRSHQQGNLSIGSFNSLTNHTPGLTQMTIDLHSNLGLERIDESLEQ